MSTAIKLMPAELMKKIVGIVASVLPLMACLGWLGSMTPARAEQDPDPSAGIFIRVYKQADGADPFYGNSGSFLENDGVMSNYRRGSLEVWAWSRVDHRYKPYKTFPIEAYRGWLGPKTQRGDHHAPEGFYAIDSFNDHSRYGKALHINYPNDHDRKQPTPWTGSQLEIHGGDVSDGCLAMDKYIGEIYNLAEKARHGGQSRIPLHILPFPMTEENMKRVRGQKEYRFWQNLKEGSDAFEATHIPPITDVDSATREYAIRPVGRLLSPSEREAPLPFNPSSPSQGRTRIVPEDQVTSGGDDERPADGFKTRPLETPTKPIDATPIEETPAVVESPVTEKAPAVGKTSLTGEPPVATAPAPASAANNACGEILKSYFGDEANREKVQAYLRIQSQLTLHRMAWSYLKTQDGSTEKMEKTIERLLGERDPSLHEKFVNGGAGVTKMSHNVALLNGVEALRDEAARRVPADDHNAAYGLKYGDFKMLNLLVEAEKSYGNGRSGGVIDFANMINSSYRGRLANKDANIRIAEKTIDRLNRQLNALAQDVQRYMAEKGCAQPLEAFTCESASDPAANLALFTELLQESVEIQDGLFSILGERKDDIREANRWGSYWLHVAASKRSGAKAR